MAITRRLWKRIAAFVCVVIEVACWVIKAEICAGLQKSTGAGALNYDKPYFISYFISSGYSIFLPIWWLVARSPLCRCMRRHRSRAILTIVPGDSDDITSGAPFRNDRFDSDDIIAARRISSPSPSAAAATAATLSSPPAATNNSTSPTRDTLDINDIASPARSISGRSSDHQSNHSTPASLTSGKPEDREPNAMESLLYRRLEFTTPATPPTMTRVVTRWSRCLPCRRLGVSGPPSHERIIMCSAILLSVAYIICGLLYVISLSSTPVSVNTVVYNSQCVVVFFLSVWLLGETIHWIKGLSVICCVAGVVIVALSASNSDSTADGPSFTFFGLIAVILSMVIYAFYEVIFSILTNGDKTEAALLYEEQNSVASDHTSGHGNGNGGGNGIQINDGMMDNVVVASSPSSLVLPPRPSPVQSALLFLGCLGLSSMLLFWPGIFIAHWSGVETFEGPSRDAWIVLWVSLGLDAILNVCVLLAIAWSSPLFVSVGTLLTIPTSILADRYLHDYHLDIWSYVGMATIVIGFIGLTALKDAKE